MKTKNLHNKKFREIINSMFNLKMFCLMKKQVFTLMMVLALVVLAGTSAWAQTGVGTAATPQFQFPGAQKVFSVTDGGNTYAWTVFDATDANVTANTTHVESSSGAATNQFTMKWAETASGSYTIRLSDTDAGSCVTQRWFYVTVANFDVNVYACTSAGVAIPDGDAALSACGINGSYNSWDNDPLNVPGLTFTDDNADGTLTGVHGTDATALNTRYVAVEISSTDIDFGTIDYYWQFPFTITSVAADADFIEATSLTTEATVAAAGESTVTVDPIGVGAGTQTKVVLQIDFNARWGIDIDWYFDIAANATLMSDDGVTYNDGEEPTSKYDSDPTSLNPLPNRSSIQTFEGSPATSVITSGN